MTAAIPLQPATAAPTLTAGLSAQGVWSFEGFRLDEGTRTLSRPDGESSVLDRSALLVLQYLLLHAGQLCTHDELLLAGWPKRRVQANSVAKCVSRLRLCLNDADGERIRLVHGYGYQLSMRCSYRAGPGLLEPAPALPAPGATLPGRPEWTVLRLIGRGACGEVLAASHSGGLLPRAYKFAIEDRGLRGLKRELAIQRYLRETCPDCEMVLPVVDAQLQQPPYFLATPLQLQGNLLEWAERGGRLRSLPRPQRVDLAIRLCESVAALHDAGIAHRDLKPQNLYVVEELDGLRVLLADLGAGAGLLPPGVDASGIPIGQLTREGTPDAQNGGPERYLAPELLMGEAATLRSDLYALGLLVYQIVVADFHRVLAPGWERFLADPLLAADIALASNQDAMARPNSARVLANRLQTLENRRAAEQEATRLDALSRQLAIAQDHAARRRRQLLATMALALLAIAALLGTLRLYLGAIAAQGAAEQSRLEAEREARTAGAVLGFLNDTLLAQADPWVSGRSDAEARALLLRASKGIDDRFAGEPAAAAAVHEAVADAWEGWGDYTEAMRHSRRALDLSATLALPMPTARARRLQALCRQARLAQRLEQSETACEAAAAIERSEQGQVSLGLQVELAKLRFEQGRCSETLKLTGQVLQSHQAEGLPAWWRDARWFRGICRGRLGDFPAARAEFEGLLGVEWPLERRQDRMLRAWVEMDFAETLVIEGDFQRASVLLHSADAVFENYLSVEHADRQLADYQWARMALWSGNALDAVRRYRSVVDHWNQQLGRDHLWTLYAEAEWLWAQAAVASGAEHVAQISRQLEALRQRALPVLAERPAQRSFFGEAWAWTALHLRDAELALSELRRARADTQAALPAGHPRLAALHCIEAQAWQQQQQHAAAREALRHCAAAMAVFPADNYRQRWLQTAQLQIGESR
ncbi:MAG: winged helix-turn-helix domain-containing protein [Xanthomonadales bacterium]|nr:winged helix-turn-helix domain-containing protein [Xanthomonadales bacterium]